MALSRTPVTSINDTATGTTVTVTLPSYSLSNYMVMVVSSNNGNAQTLSSAVTGTVLANAANRLIAYKLVPIDGSQTSFTITVASSSVFTWWIATYSGVSATATVSGVGNNIGNSTTSTVEMPTLSVGYSPSGNELLLYSGAVNATATWTTTPDTIFNTTTGNGALMVLGMNTTTALLTYTPPSVDRGNDTVSRNESALFIILQPTGNIAPIANNAEGGTDGTLVTTTNSGGASGTVMNQVDGTCTFTTENRFKGRMGYKIAPPGATTSFLQIQGNTGAQAVMRGYVYLTGYPTASIQLFSMRFSSSTVGRYALQANGVPALQGGSNGIFTIAMPLNTWLRLELAIDTVASTITGSWYKGDSLTPVETKVQTAITSTFSPNQLTMGKSSSTGTITPFYVDDLAFLDGTTTFLGPTPTPNASGMMAAF